MALHVKCVVLVELLNRGYQPLSKDDDVHVAMELNHLSHPVQIAGAVDVFHVQSFQFNPYWNQWKIASSTILVFRTLTFF